MALFKVTELNAATNECVGALTQQLWYGV